MTADPDHRRRPQGDTERSALDVAQTVLLYSNLPTSIVINALLALILVSVQSPVIATSRWLAWLALLGSILLGRTLLLMAWKRAGAAQHHDIRRWLRRFRIGVIATGIVWGIGGVLLSPPGNIPHQVYVAFVLAGLGAGAITALAIDRVSTIGFLLPALLPHIIFLAAKGGEVHIGMSTMIILFLIFIAASARRSGDYLRDNVLLRIKAVENEARFREILESTPIATRIADADSNRVIFANTSYINLIGSTPEQVIGIIPSRYYANPQEYADVAEQLRKGGHITDRLVELRAPETDAWKRWVLASYFPIEFQDKPAILGWFYDITDRKIMEDQVEHLAYHDTLTGLPNRLLFRDRLQQALSVAERDKASLALMFIDLDRFKPVNDHYGHDIGDLLLKAAAERIRSCLRKTDTVARIGGDEFVVLLPVIKTEQNALKIAEDIRRALDRDFDIAKLTLGISSSIGVAIYPNHATLEQQLIKCADTAMYHAKTDCNKVKIYRTEMQETDS